MIDKLFDHKTIKADNFSWSIARQELFNFCERACFYHYYGASGGFDSYAEPDVRKLYLLKKLIPGKLWIDNIFSKTLRGMLLQSGMFKTSQDMLKEFSRRLIREFHLGQSAVTAKEWRQDPGKLNLLELYYNEAPPDEYFAVYWNLLESFFKSFSASNLPETLCKVDSLDWKRIAIPADFAIGKLQLWLAPDLIWQNGDSISFLDINGSGQHQNKHNTYAVLNAIMAEEKFRTQPDKTISIFFNAVTGKTEIPGVETLNISRTLEDISACVSRMLEKVSPDGTVQGITFFRSEVNCAKCKFREFCRSTN